MTNTNDPKIHAPPVVEALVGLLRPLVDEAVRQMHQPSEGRHTLAPKLITVRQASEVLGTNPDAIRRLVHAGELTGYPFPDENSNLHVESSSIDDLLTRRREEHQPVLRLAKTGTDGRKGWRR